MTDERTRDIEARLSAAFARQTLPAAPVSIYRHLEHVVDLAPPTRPRPRRRFVYIGVLLLLIALIWAFAGIILLMSGSGAAPPHAEASASPAYASSASGLSARTVGEVLELRAAGALARGPVPLTGYWTNRSFGHSCAPPNGQPGALEMYCHDGEYGITQRPEAILERIRHSQVIPATGPHLTPFIEEALIEANPSFAFAFTLREAPPIPIVVVGHFDDPRAEECRPEARQLCLDRFVLDRIVSFDPATAIAVTPSPRPTPFPYDNPPPSPFDPARCEGVNDPEFVGWKTAAELGLPDYGGHIWAVISREMPLTDWAGPSGGRQYRVWGKRLCYAYEWEQGSLVGGPLPGSTYKLWSDGTITPG